MGWIILGFLAFFVFAVLNLPVYVIVLSVVGGLVMASVIKFLFNILSGDRSYEYSNLKTFF